jgi:hypothetical protein
MSANLIVGKDPDGNKVPVAVDAAGQLKVTGGGGGGGSTDMTVANAQLIAINANTDGLEGKADTGNALLTTQAADTALIKDEAIAIDAKLPSLSSGRIPVEANNAASQVYNYTATGAVAGSTTLVPSVDCSFFREVSVHLVSAGTGFFFKLQISNDNTNWSDCPACTSGGNVALAQFGTAGLIYNYSLLGARFFRIMQVASQSAGTTTLVAYASQQATPKLYQSVSGSVSVISGSVITPIANVGLGMALYHSLVSAASTNATSVKGSSGVIGTLILTNSSATWAYFKLVNKASAPTVGTDTAIINIGVAPNTTLNCSTSFAGLRMATGIAYYVSAGTSLTDNTALPAAGTFLVNMTYV